MQRSKNLLRAVFAAALLLTGEILLAIQTQEVDLGVGGSYDSLVVMTRDGSGRMTFRDTQVTTPTTLAALLAAKSNYIEQYATQGAAGTAPVSDGAGGLAMTAVATIAGLDAKADKSTALGAGAGLTGGGDLSTNRTFALDYTSTLAGNPAMNAGEARFGTTGLLLEGSAADALEGLLTIVNPTADRTWTLPDASGTVAIAASSPLSESAAGLLSIANAAADGATKGAAAFQAADFNDNGAGLLSLDYSNGQPATSGQNGFLSATDWITFNNKQSALGTGNLLPLNSGGTNANLSANNGGIFYSTASAGAILPGTANANKPLLSGATAAPAWAGYTIPSSVPASGKILVSDGTNIVASTPSFPNASASAGKIIRSDGTNWAASTTVWPNGATVNSIPYATSTNTYGESSNFTFNGSTFKVGSGTPLVAGAAEIWSSNAVNDAAGNVNIYSTNAAAVDAGGSVGFGGTNGAGSVYVYAKVAGRYEAANYGGYLQFLTTNTVGTVGEKGRFTSAGFFGVNTTTPRQRVDLLDASNPQLRLTQADNSKFADLRADSNGYLTLSPSGSQVGVNGAPGEGLDVVFGNARVKTGTLQVGNVSAAAYNRIGTAATNRGLSAASDLLIGGTLEIDGALHADGAIYRSGQRLISGANLLDNPDFNIWQRNITMTAASGGDSGGTLTYPVPGVLSLGADRWQASRAKTDMTATISRATPPGGLATAQYAMKIEETAGAPCRFYVHQTLTRERTFGLRGKWLTFAASVYETGTGGGNIAIYKTIGGTPTELARYTFTSSSNSWDRVAVTAQIPADAETVLVSVQPELSSAGTTTAYLANMTLVEGIYVATNERATDPAASSLPPLPKEPAADLEACQRFYEKGALYFTAFAPDNATYSHVASIHYNTAKAAASTISISNLASGPLTSVSSVATEQPAYSAGTTWPQGFRFSISGNSSTGAPFGVQADWTAACAEPI